MASSTKTPVSPAIAKAPELTISVAAINNEPIELDATPPSPERAGEIRRGSLDALEAYKDLSPEEKERRKQLILNRKTDPAVLVDIPKTPQAEELEKARTITRHWSENLQ